MHFSLSALRSAFKRIGLIRVIIRLACARNHRALDSGRRSRNQEIFIRHEFQILDASHLRFYLHIGLFLLLIKAILPNRDLAPVAYADQPSLRYINATPHPGHEIILKRLVCEFTNIPDSKPPVKPH